MSFTGRILAIWCAGNAFTIPRATALLTFKNDFAGRIANKLLQCGNALRDATLSIVVALVFVGTIFITNVILVLQVSFALALPQILWVFAYISILSFFLPKIKMRATATASP